MNGFRFSLATLFGLVLATGLVLGVWRYGASDGAARAALAAFFFLCTSLLFGSLAVGIWKASRNLAKPMTRVTGRRDAKSAGTDPK